MSRRNRGRITIQHQPTGASRAMMRMMGAIHASMGIAFVLAAVTTIIPNAGFFGFPFFLGGAFFAVNGIRMLVGKNDFAHRVGYDIETDMESESIVGIMDEPKSEPEQQESPIVIDPKRTKARLEQLETMKNAGLITKEEYREKRQEIIDSL